MPMSETTCASVSLWYIKWENGGAQPCEIQRGGWEIWGLGCLHQHHLDFCLVITKWPSTDREALSICAATKCAGGRILDSCGRQALGAPDQAPLDAQGFEGRFSIATPKYGGLCGGPRTDRLRHIAATAARADADHVRYTPVFAFVRHKRNSRDTRVAASRNRPYRSRRRGVGTWMARQIFGILTEWQGCP